MAILIGLWPLAALVGYLVAGIWVGDWVLSRSVGDPAQRPYRAAILGVVILELLSAVPVLGVVTAIASLFGFGAVLLLAWRTLRGTTAISAPAPRHVVPPQGAQGAQP